MVMKNCKTLYYGSAATFWIAAFSKLKSSLDVQTRTQFGLELDKIDVWEL